MSKSSKLKSQKTRDSSSSKRSRKAKDGLSPGALVYLGDERSHTPVITTIRYTPEEYQEEQVCSVEVLAAEKDSQEISWINITGVHDVECIREIGEVFSIHSLALEDIVTTTQRPKIDSFENHVLAILRMAIPGQGTEIKYEQISLVLGPTYVISFQELPGDIFGAIRKRLQSPQSTLRRSGADYLLYCIMDTIVDKYFVLLEEIGDQLEEFDERALISFREVSLQDIHQLKREVFRLRKTVFPLREMLSGIRVLQASRFNEATHVYFRDLRDHILQLIDMIDSYRDWLSSITDLYISQMDNHMNQVMKVLTVIASIFIPLTFITSLYGMNFHYMPELDYRYGYFATLGGMAVLAGIILLFFKKRDWL